MTDVATDVQHCRAHLRRVVDGGLVCRRPKRHSRLSRLRLLGEAPPKAC
jgi:hypothetical protein